MKILFLNGYGQNYESFKSTFNNLEKYLIQTYGEETECHYLIAPHPVKNYKDKDGFGWFTFKDILTFFKAEEYIGVEVSLKYIKDYIEEYGPFDGIVGYSQGSAMTTIILGQQLHTFKILGQQLHTFKILGQQSYPFKFAILVGSYVITDQRYVLYEKIETPTLHIAGQKDLIVNINWSRDNYDKYVSDKIFHEHKKGHIIPEDNVSLKVIIDFIDALWR